MHPHSDSEEEEGGGWGHRGRDQGTGLWHLDALGPIQERAWAGWGFGPGLGGLDGCRHWWPGLRCSSARLGPALLAPGAVPPWCSLPTRWLFLEILLYYQVLPYSPSSSPSCTCPPCPPAIWVMHLPLQPEPALAPFTPLLRRSGTGWSNMARSPLPRLVTLWALSSLG